MQAIQSQSYSVYFNEECYTYLTALLQPGTYSGIFILADSNTAQFCLPHFLQMLVTETPIEIIEVEPGEANKSIETCVQLWHTLTELGADRKSLLINVGGGMVTDLGGFTASTFKRGIDFINVPTSLLAMVDASVGGKTGVDLGALKNQIGVINNPIAVLTDIHYLDTLPQRDMRSGLAEMLKHGIIADRAYWNNFTDMEGLTTDDLTMLVYRSIEIKNDIVQQDPTEKNIRKLLNFGHTLGHAIESYFLDKNDDNPLLHGEAIAAGMVLEAHISVQKNLLPVSDYIEIKSVILSIFEKVDFTFDDITEIIQLLAHDKKNEFGAVNFVLPQSVGNAIINQTAGNDLIYKAFEDYHN